MRKTANCEIGAMLKLESQMNGAKVGIHMKKIGNHPENPNKKMSKRWTRKQKR